MTEKRYYFVGKKSKLNQAVIENSRSNCGGVQKLPWYNIIGVFASSTSAALLLLLTPPPPSSLHRQTSKRNGKRWFER